MIDRQRFLSITYKTHTNNNQIGKWAKDICEQSTRLEYYWKAINTKFYLMNRQTNTNENNLGNCHIQINQVLIYDNYKSR